MCDLQICLKNFSALIKISADIELKSACIGTLFFYQTLNLLLERKASIGGDLCATRSPAAPLPSVYRFFSGLKGGGLRCYLLQKGYQKLALLFSYVFYYLCGMYTKDMPYTLLYIYCHTDRLSIWLSVDPLSDKYPHLSPYVYCADNPVKYIDPDGMKIVGTDGKPVTFSPDKGWSSNAPKDVIKVGNAIKSRFKG